MKGGGGRVRHRWNTLGVKTNTQRRLGREAIALLAVCGVMLASRPIWAVNLAAPPSLKTIVAPEPSNLGLFIKSDPQVLNADGYPVPTADARKAAIALGK